MTFNLSDPILDESLHTHTHTHTAAVLRVCVGESPVVSCMTTTLCPTYQQTEERGSVGDEEGPSIALSPQGFYGEQRVERKKMAESKKMTYK